VPRPRCSSQLKLGNLPNMASIALLQLSPHQPTVLKLIQSNRIVLFARSACSTVQYKLCPSLRIIMHKFVQIRATVVLGSWYAQSQLVIMRWSEWISWGHLLIISYLTFISTLSVTQCKRELLGDFEAPLACLKVQCNLLAQPFPHAIMPLSYWIART
jgi:hypothetical protein